MTEGLITRIGRWLDNEWKVKATEETVDQLRLDLTQAIRLSNDATDRRITALSERIDLLRTPEGAEKEVADLKTRIEKIELYAGMTRKVDPTKPPVVKSAFSM